MVAVVLDDDDRVRRDSDEGFNFSFRRAVLGHYPPREGTTQSAGVGAEPGPELVLSLAGEDV